MIRLDERSTCREKGLPCRWYGGAGARATKNAALRTGIELGMTVIGDSEAEVLVDKAYPQNASNGQLPRACEASLRRPGTDRLDRYLLHWRASVLLEML